MPTDEVNIDKIVVSLRMLPVLGSLTSLVVSVPILPKMHLRQSLVIHPPPPHIVASDSIRTSILKKEKIKNDKENTINKKTFVIQYNII